MKRFITMMGAGLLLIQTSCSEDALDKEPLESALTQTEVHTILNTDRTAGAMDTFLSQLYLTNSTTARSVEVDCYTLENIDNGFAVHFDNCDMNGGAIANGTLHLAYGIGSGMANFTVTYDGFYIGDVKINGTRSYTLQDTVANSFSISIESTMVLEYANGQRIVENGTKTLELVIEAGEDTFWELDGVWTAELNGSTYQMDGTMTKDFTCEHWTEGALNIVKNGQDATLDFGAGDCDDQATLEFANGSARSITL